MVLDQVLPNNKGQEDSWSQIKEIGGPSFIDGGEGAVKNSPRSYAFMVLGRVIPPLDHNRGWTLLKKIRGRIPFVTNKMNRVKILLASTSFDFEFNAFPRKLL